MLKLHVGQIVTLLLRHDCESFTEAVSVLLLSKGDFGDDDARMIH